MFGSMLIVIWYAVRLVQAHELTFGQMTQFLLYTMYIGGATGQFTRLYGELQRTLGATRHIRELLREPREEVALQPAPLPTLLLPPPGSTGRFSGDIVFGRVTFSYPTRRDFVVLKDLSLHAKAGERVALVGPSGAGKSTIVSLLLRFYDPDQGHVLFDGRDAREYPLDRRRGQMAIVPQDVLLFGGTIVENIAYGRPGAAWPKLRRPRAGPTPTTSLRPSQKAIRHWSAIEASSYPEVSASVWPLHAPILKDPAILILDEATSSLDSESESLVQSALDSLMQGRTSVIIAHRLATVRRADQIFVIKEGEVLESGTHEQLVCHEGGLYRTLSELQFDLGRSATIGRESALIE